MSTVPCELCSMPTPMTGTKRCDRCWELEHRIHGDPELARKILSLVQPEAASASALKGAIGGILLRIVQDYEPYKAPGGFTRWGRIQADINVEIDQAFADINAARSLTPSPQPRTREDEARECLAIARNYAGSWLSPTADEIVTALERRVNEHAGNVLQSPPAHNLYREGDPGAPDSIKDRNGEIVLGLCKRCGRGEAELTEPCSQPQLGQGSDK